MAEKYITMMDISFSGFWSQGDGASFVGYINNNKLFLQTHDLTEDYPAIVRLLEHGGNFSFSIERTRSIYVHENTVSASVYNADTFAQILRCKDDLREAILEQWDKDLELEYDRLADETTTIIRGYCRQLYNQLKEEYEYLTSDELVWETILANELDEPEEEEIV
jgi:ERCC4-type nuclease